MKKALVTAIGSFASDIVIKTLKEEGIYVIGCDIYPKEWVAQSLDTDGFYQAPYAADKEEYIAFIKKVSTGTAQYHFPASVYPDSILKHKPARHA